MAAGHNLLISYDLVAPTKNYVAVAEAIQRLGAAVRPNLSHWFVDSAYTAEQAAKAVATVMDANDKLMVVDAMTNTTVWYNLDPDTSQFIQSRWNS